MAHDPTTSHSSSPAAFPVTHWTLVAQLRGTEAEARHALESLCRNYWYPVYATLRRQGCTPHDAEDLTQSFFAELLAGKTLRHASADRGRLRNFLLGTLRRFLADQARHRLAKKRGGGTEILSIEWEHANQRYVALPVDTDDPEKIYARTWVGTLLDQVREKLRRGYVNREAAYAALEPFIEGDHDTVPFRELGARLGQTEAGARVTVFRLRQRFRELLTEAVRQTVQTPSEVEDELAWVLATLASTPR